MLKGKIDMSKKKNKNINEPENNSNYQERFVDNYETTNTHGGDGYIANTNNGDYPVQYPKQINRDYIAVMDDETLYNLGRSLSDSINRVSRFNLNSYPWEVEMCYVQYEVQLRAARRTAHSVWVNTTSTMPEIN